MKKASLFILFAVFSLVVNAQDFAPVGSYWNYSFSQHDGSYDGQETLYVERDSMLDGTRMMYLSNRFHYYWNGPPWFPNG